MRLLRLESSKLFEEETGWNLIRDLKVPGMVKPFIWKVEHDLLSTRQNLVKKHFTDTKRCKKKKKTVNWTKQMSLVWYWFYFF